MLPKKPKFRNLPYTVCQQQNVMMIMRLWSLCDIWSRKITIYYRIWQTFIAKISGLPDIYLLL